MQKFLKAMKKTILIALILVIAGVNANAQNKKNTKVTHLTYSEFIQKVWDFEKSPNTFQYKGEVPAIIDFYADWCGPCRRTAPVLERIAKEYNGKLVVYKINVDEERALASLFQVQGIPALLFIPMEGKPQMTTGAMDEDGFKAMIKKHLLK